MQFGISPYLLRYRGAFACSLILCPLLYRYTLRCTFPGKGEQRVYHVSHTYSDGLGSACSPMVLLSARQNGTLRAPDHIPFGSSLSASLAR